MAEERYKPISKEQDIDELRVGDVVNFYYPDCGRFLYNGRHARNNKYVFFGRRPDGVIIEFRFNREELSLGQNGLLNGRESSDFTIFHIDDINGKSREDLLKKVGL